MGTSAVEQILNGIRVRCADGAVVECKPLVLKRAREIITLWKQRFAPAPAELPADASDTAKAERAAQAAQHSISVARARLGVVDLFAELYPELIDHLSPGDVEALLPDFFWSATGATLEAETLPSPPTGTASSAAISPAGASSPTP
jgi:hypothetical protein